jgi:ubiquinone/menaquinone biosynthesis C-methylase UbiE
MSDSEPRRDPKGTELEYLETIPLSSEDRVLDIGCGDGRLTDYFTKEVNFIVGTDIKIESIREAQSAHPPGQLPQQHFTASRAEAIPFAEQTFSMAIFTWSL